MARTPLAGLDEPHSTGRQGGAPCGSGRARVILLDDTQRLLLIKVQDASLVVPARPLPSDRATRSNEAMCPGLVMWPDVQHSTAAAEWHLRQRRADR